MTVEARAISGYVSIGGFVRYAIGVQEGWPIFGKDHIIQNIEEFEGLCEKYGLHVTRRVCKSTLGTYAKKWNEECKDLSEEARLERVMQKSEVQDFARQAWTLETALMAEAKGIFAHVTRDKRYSTEKLLNDISFLMAPGVFENLPEVAQYDFSQAGRCIAFETPTAAAFHLMRGTEDVLRWFYKSLVKRGRKQLMWGPMVSHLASRRNAPPQVLLNNLDNLRKNFRNPTQHPEKIYDIQEVQDLLALSLDVVNRMVKYIHPQKPEGDGTSIEGSENE
ncbi:hypothetical protein ABZ744_21400 [Micromonospora chersina]|uniref:hypothetical protein n=1 Tax=Micromonospora chersina TaxID=47854 RepID=UPI0033F7CAAE